jgi:WS/DGAT/MGAT family acyltransferase
VITKTHHSMVDGAAAIDIAEVLLDASAEPRRTVGVLWMPEPEPSDVKLVGEALLTLALRPAALADAVWLSTGGARSKAAWLTGAASAVGAVVAGALKPARPSPFRAGPGQHRRIAITRTRLEDFRRVRRGLGGTVNDAMLATVAGALRNWLLSRGEAMRPLTMVRALVPVSVAGDGAVNVAGDVLGENGESTSRVTGLLVDLPVGERDPVARLFHVQQAMSEHTHTRGPGAGSPVGAEVLVALSGFAPPTLHALGARAANGLTRRAYSLAVTNVPGPQLPLYAAGARLTEMFPILPLNEGEALSIAWTSYDGGVFFGLNGDRDAVPDIAALASFVVAALAELVDAASAEHAATGPRGYRAAQAQQKVRS